MVFTLSLVIILVLKSSLKSIMLLRFFSWLVFVCTTFSIFLFYLCIYILNVSFRQHMAEPFFFFFFKNTIQQLLQFNEFRLLKFNVIINMVEFKSTIFILVFYILPFSYFLLFFWIYYYFLFHFHLPYWLISCVVLFTICILTSLSTLNNVILFNV